MDDPDRSAVILPARDTALPGRQVPSQLAVAHARDAGPNTEATWESRRHPILPTYRDNLVALLAPLVAARSARPPSARGKATQRLRSSGYGEQGFRGGRRRYGGGRRFRRGARVCPGGVAREVQLGRRGWPGGTPRRSDPAWCVANTGPESRKAERAVCLDSPLYVSSWHRFISLLSTLFQSPPLAGRSLSGAESEASALSCVALPLSSPVRPFLLPARRCSGPGRGTAAATRACGVARRRSVGLAVSGHRHPAAAPPGSCPGGSRAASRGCGW